MSDNTATANKVISGLWVCRDGAPLSNLERLCIHSFCANGHDFCLYCYGNIPNVPKPKSGGRVEVRNAEEIVPQSKIFLVRKSLAMFADWFRWELLRQKGGWYVDMDMVWKT